MRCHLVCAWLLLFGATSSSAFGQFLSVGVKAGVPLNDAFENGGLSTSTDRYIIGPQIELHLPFHLGIEAEALYRHYAIAGNGASEWDFPILLKYHFNGVPLVHPFVDGGPVFNHVSDIGFATINSSTTGFALGAGLDFHALIHITPEIRYVRWGDRNFSAGIPATASNQNQAQFLVGFTF